MNVIRFKKSFFVIHLVICILNDLSFLLMHTLLYQCILIHSSNPSTSHSLFLFFVDFFFHHIFAVSSVLKACLGHFNQLKVLISIEEA